MRSELQDIRRLAAALRENLSRCAADPDVDPVHDARTGTRRLQATVENLLRSAPQDDTGAAMRDAAEPLMRLLKKIRRAAGPVRDLDVHRKLLEKLTRRALGEKKKDARPETPQPAPIPDEPDVLETPEAGLRTTGLEQQSDRLDTWLRDRREKESKALQKQAAGMANRLDERVQALEQALRALRGRKKAKAPAEAALDSFARLATEMQLLDAGNLHDFRKGAKKARYVAELAAQGDTQADAVGKTLKKLQDEIGDWHDWLVLFDEARTALGGDGGELTGLIDSERERHFVAAMKTAAKLRGRLMGEWLAAGQGKGQLRSRQRKAGQRKAGQLKPARRGEATSTAAREKRGR